MKITNVNRHVVIQLTDRQAEELVQRLAAVHQRRKELIAAEPSMRAWADSVAAMPGTIDSKDVNISITICGSYQ